MRIYYPRPEVVYTFIKVHPRIYVLELEVDVSLCLPFR